MNKNLITVGAVAGVLLASGAAGMAWANAEAGSTAVSEAQAIEIALAEVPGEVREIVLEIEGVSRTYEIGIINTAGVEMEVEIDAETGMVLEVEAEDGENDED